MAVSPASAPRRRGRRSETRARRHPHDQPAELLIVQGIEAERERALDAGRIPHARREREQRAKRAGADHPREKGQQRMHAWMRHMRHRGCAARDRTRSTTKAALPRELVCWSVRVPGCASAGFEGSVGAVSQNGYDRALRSAARRLDVGVSCAHAIAPLSLREIGRIVDGLAEIDSELVVCPLGGEPYAHARTRMSGASTIGNCREDAPFSLLCDVGRFGSSGRFY